MNKEFAQEWDAPSAVEAAPAPAAAKSNVVALKQIVTIRLDTDMLEWFKGNGPGYQTRINQILRQYMADHRNDGAVNQ
ncbi:MAG: BrnA antitoxin family protein [Pseudomonadota bacterium]